MNIHWLDDLSVFYELVGPLRRPGHGFVSFMQLCKRQGLGDDRGRRAVGGLEGRWHRKLIGTDERRRLFLTADGLRACDLAVQERLLRGGNDEDNAETVTAEMPPAIAAAVLPDVLPGFLEIYAGLVQVRIVPLVASAVKANIANRCTTFGVGWSDDDAPAGDTLPVTIPWCGVGSALHRLHASDAPLEAAELQDEDRVLIPGDMGALPAIRSWLEQVPLSNRLECDCWAAIRKLAASGIGLALLLDLNPNEKDSALFKRPLAGVEGMKLRLYLPRRAADLSEPAQALVDGIRRAVESRFASGEASGDEMLTAAAAQAELDEAKPKLAETAERKVSA